MSNSVNKLKYYNEMCLKYQINIKEIYLKGLNPRVYRIVRLYRFQGFLERLISIFIKS